MAMIAAAAVATGILPQARQRCAPNRKPLGCDSAEGIALLFLPSPPFRCRHPKYSYGVWGSALRCPSVAWGEA